MEFELEGAVPVLRRTPAVLDQMLRGLPESWIAANEGPDTWSPLDVVGHLIHCERTNWPVRVRHLLDVGESEPFPPFNRFGHLDFTREADLADLLDLFATVRNENLAQIASLKLTATDMRRTARHSDFGVVTLGQLLATWVVHDLDHLTQVVRVMAKQYRDEVGPWRQYLRILKPA